MKTLKSIIASIPPLDREIEPQILDRLNRLTKPPGSLGKLEDLVLQYCLITNTVKPRLEKKKIFVFAGDHGVAKEGVSAYPKAVTTQMVQNMLSGGAAINVLSRLVGSELCLVDIGVDGCLEEKPGLILKKVKPGTENMAEGEAMSIDEALLALEAGAGLAMQEDRNGATLIGTGEMGIGNTTAASALYSALLPCPVEEVTGRGTGIDDEALSRKIRVIQKSLRINRARLSDPLSALAALGGLEIAGLCGLILGAASCRLPVVVDGFISSAAALVACRMCPAAGDYLFFSHCSAEAGHKIFFKSQGIEPLLSLNMRLGEGTGAALAMSIIEASINLYNEMATFRSAEISEKTI